MKTTIEIPEVKHRLLKGKASSNGQTLKELFIMAVNDVLLESSPKPLPRLKLPLIESDNPGSLYLDNKMIYDLIGFP
jgi:hypothetical protein